MILTAVPLCRPRGKQKAREPHCACEARGGEKAEDVFLPKLNYFHEIQEMGLRLGSSATSSSNDMCTAAIADCVVAEMLSRD